MVLTHESQQFIKAAACAPDNDLTPRVPDGSGARTFTQKFAKQQVITTKPGQTRIIVCTPTLPVSCYTTVYTTSAGYLPVGGFYPTLDSFGQEYLETKTEFPQWGTIVGPTGLSNTASVDAARVLSLSAELECTTNSFNQYGTVQCFKSPMSLTNNPEIISGSVLGPSSLTITGAACIPPEGASSGSYLSFVKDGAYSVSMNRMGGSGDFHFTELIDNAARAETVTSNITATTGGVDQILWKGMPLFWDNNYDSIVFKIVVPDGVPSPQSFILKNWITVEMRTVYGSFLHGIAQPAPAKDPQAFKLYGALQSNLPVAVPSKDNPDFWNTVLSIIKPLSGMASLLPGPIGAVGKGVHAVSSVLSASSKKTKGKLNVGKYQLQLKNKSKPKQNTKKQRRVITTKLRK